MNALLVVFVPSLTLTVMEAVPDLPAAGVTVTVRFAPEPPNTMLAVGTSVVDDDVPETVRLAAAVSASPIVNGIAAVAWPEATVCAAIVEMVGAVFGAGAWTVKVNALLVVFVPSLTVTVIVALPVLPDAGVTVTVRFAPEPPRTMFAVGTKVVEEEDFVSVRFAAGVSASPIVNGIAAVDWPDVTVCAAIVEMVGAVFGAAWTVTAKLLLAVSVPSPTVIVICAVPVFPAAGVTVTVRFAPLPPSTMLPFGINVVTVDDAESVKLEADVSASPIVNAIAEVDWPEITAWEPIAEMVGAVFVAPADCTVKVNPVLAVFVPSLTVKVICAEPLKPGAGVTTTVRLAPVPPRRIFPIGTNVVSEDTPVTIKLPADVSESDTENAIAAVDCPALTAWSAIDEIDGMPFPKV